MPPRPEIGRPAPTFELPVYRPTVEGDGPQMWSLADRLDGDRTVVLVFHRHIH